MWGDTLPSKAKKEALVSLRQLARKELGVFIVLCRPHVVRSTKKKVVSSNFTVASQVKPALGRMTVVTISKATGTPYASCAICYIAVLRAIIETETIDVQY